MDVVGGTLSSTGRAKARRALPAGSTANPMGGVQPSLQPIVERLDKTIDMTAIGAVINDGGANDRTAIEGGKGRRSDPAFVQILDELAIQFTILTAPGAKANNVEADGRREFEGGRLLNSAFEMARNFAAARDCRTKSFRAQSLKGEPGLQRPKSSRQIRPQITRPGLARRQSPRCALEIVDRICKGVAVRRAVADQKKPRIIGHMRPFMEVEGD